MQRQHAEGFGSLRGGVLHQFAAWLKLLCGYFLSNDEDELSSKRAAFVSETISLVETHICILIGSQWDKICSAQRQIIISVGLKTRKVWLFGWFPPICRCSNLICEHTWSPLGPWSPAQLQTCTAWQSQSAEWRGKARNAKNIHKNQIYTCI